MKKFVFGCCLFLGLTDVAVVFSQQQWTYPVTPGSSEWRQIPTYSERVAVQQIPLEVLNDMSTQELFRAWMSLPGRIDVLAYDTMQKGFDVSVKRYNVLQSLLEREDAGSIILEKYLKTGPAFMQDDWSSLKKGQFITDIGYIELTLAQPEILQTLTPDQMKSVINISKTKLQEKMALNTYDRDFFWEETGAILIGRTLQQVNFPDFIEWIAEDPGLKSGFQRANIPLKYVRQDVFGKIIQLSNAYLLNWKEQ